MAWQRLTPTINIGSTSRSIRIKSKVLFNSTQTWQDQTRSTTKLSTNNQGFNSGKQLPKFCKTKIGDMIIISSISDFYFRKAVYTLSCIHRFWKTTGFLLKENICATNNLVHRHCGIGPFPKNHFAKFSLKETLERRGDDFLRKG